ncbi:MAG: arginase family protein [Pseudolysinimonas sp.]
MNITVLDAPSNLGLRPGRGGRISGVDRAPAAVRAAGLLQRIAVQDAGAVTAPPYDISGWEPGAPFNAAAIGAFTIELADRIESLDADKLLLLGGDCSILLGPLLALRRRTRPGLVFIDAHSDFRHENVDAAAGEELAIATGRGGHFLTDLEGRGPLLADDQVAMIGLRETDDVPFAQVTTARDALDHLTADDIWVHLDVDVLDPSYMPAVDSPEPGGLSPDQLVDILRPLLRDDRVRGIDVCIYDPALDSAGLPGATLVADLLGRVFSQ